MSDCEGTEQLRIENDRNLPDRKETMQGLKKSFCQNDVRIFRGGVSFAVRFCLSVSTSVSSLGAEKAVL